MTQHLVTGYHGVVISSTSSLLASKAICLNKIGSDEALTFQISDERYRFDGIACVGKGLDDMVLHYTNHTESRLVT